MSGRRPVRVCLHHYHGGARSKDKRVRVKGLQEFARPQRGAIPTRRWMTPRQAA